MIPTLFNRVQFGQPGRKIPHLQFLTTNVGNGRVVDVFDRPLVTDELPEIFGVEVRCSVEKDDQFFTELLDEGFEQGDPMLGGQVLLGREVQRITVVRDRTERGHFRSGVPNRTTGVRSDRIPATTALGSDILRGLVDGSERPAVLDQLSFFEPCPGTLLRLPDPPGSVVAWPNDM